jgi:hypothetical protein
MQKEWHTATKPLEKNMNFIYLFLVIAEAKVT